MNENRKPLSAYYQWDDDGYLSMPYSAASKLERKEAKLRYKVRSVWMTASNERMASIMAAYAMCRMPNLREFRFGRPMVAIGEKAFWGDSSLELVEFMPGLETIGNEAFRGCTSLEHIEIPEGVTSIGDRAFMDCTSLRLVRLPSTLKSIGSECFLHCLNLPRIEVPEGCTVGENAFSGCEEDIQQRWLNPPVYRKTDREPLGIDDWRTMSEEHLLY